MVTSATHDIHDAFFDALREEAHEHRNLVVLTSDIGVFRLDRFKTALPGQIIDAGIAEQDLINQAADLARGGKRVVACFVSAFVLQRCYEQIKVNVADPGLPVTIACIGPGIAHSNERRSHYAVQDVANVRVLPNFTILSPADPSGFAAAARMVCRKDGPLYVRLDNGSFPDLPGQPDEEGLRVVVPGGTILLLTTGIMGQQLPALVERLGAGGVKAGAILVERLKPLDEERVAAILRRYDAVVTIEEHLLTGGLGSSIAELIVDRDLATPLLRLGLPDTVVDLLDGNRDRMLAQMGLDPASLEQRIVAYLERRSATRVGTAGNRSVSAEGTVDTLDLPRFARLLGLPESAFSPQVRAYMLSTDFGYRVLGGPEKEALQVEILRIIDSGTLTTSGPQKRAIWEKGWSENLTEFVNSDNDPATLRPRCFRAGAVKRLDGEYIVPSNPEFELALVKVLRDTVCGQYFRSADAVFEFGCGTGLNLLALAEIFPEKRFVGLDWAQPSCDIVNRLASARRLPLEGRLFDMFRPDASLALGPSDAVFTMGALEQLGEDFTEFVAFLLAKKPLVCVNCETMDEIYERPTVADYAARRYGEVRHYLRGFLTHLRRLERDGQVEIVQVQRTSGNQFHEGHSFVVWRPSTKTVDADARA